MFRAQKEPKRRRGVVTPPFHFLHRQTDKGLLHLATVLFCIL